MKAERESRCAICDDMILVGDSIAYLDVEDEWVHLNCSDEEAS